MPRRLFCCLAALPLVLLTVGCQASRFNSVADAYAYRGVPQPTASRIVATSGYSCRLHHTLPLTPELLAALRTRFTPPPASAAAERQSLSESLAWMEAYVGARNGTSADLPGSTAGTFQDGQMNCIDESLNLTTYLLVLEQDGLLHHHSVRPPTQRMNLAVAKFPHWTAVIHETATGRDWSLDSYFHACGEPPEIQPLADWLRFRHPANHPYLAAAEY